MDIAWPEACSAEWVPAIAQKNSLYLKHKYWWEQSSVQSAEHASGKLICASPFTDLEFRHCQMNYLFQCPWEGTESKIHFSKNRL